MIAEFVVSATRPEQFPQGDYPEYAFLGRSNVGKSTLLNTLLREKNLARTSSTPGRTRLINFFRVDQRLLLVDLPGYGYAHVSKAQQRSWQPMVEAYLSGRRQLVLSFLLLDARRAWMQPDLELKEWLEYHQRRFLVIATKVDKLRTQREKRQSLAAIRAYWPEEEPVLFSAETGQGVSEIWQAIRKTT
jgi:GTP-binding protein